MESRVVSFPEFTEPVSPPPDETDLVLGAPRNRAFWRRGYDERGS